jgi:hypothetical protein
MSWQEKFVNVVMLELADNPGILIEKKYIEAALRAALPLIEVTPAMKHASYRARDDGVKAALTVCATEGRDEQDG